MKTPCHQSITWTFLPKLPEASGAYFVACHDKNTDKDQEFRTMLLYFAKSLRGFHMMPDAAYEFMPEPESMNLIPYAWTPVPSPPKRD